ncbi:GapR family DNA-binding domain-containing protein [Rhizobium leguminosarum]|uniref:GapR family DNA-binding domain-containing protein n=1 Tax=Rhizobium leguminosarum TaxID=384 RepID=UPI003F9569AC
MTADKQLKAYIDRVLRLKEEQDTIGDDIREIYAEAKAAGYDKTIMGKLVAHLRRELKQGAGAVAEAESIFDTYLNAYQRASGTPVATHTHEEEFDPITGEFLDKPVNAKLVSTVATGMQTEIGRKALIAAVDIMIAREDAEEQNAPRPSENDKPCSKAVPQDKPSPAGIGSELLAGREGRHEGEAAPVGLPANPEMDREQMRVDEVGHSLPAENARKAGPETEDGSVNHAGAGEIPATSCEYCDDTGDVHRIDGEWLGFCHCEYGKRLQGDSEIEIDPTEDRKEGHSLDGNADANAGGGHVNAHSEAATYQAGSLVESDPAITFEACPRMPMKALSYAHCFPELSKTAYQCLAGDIALNGVLEPIVRMGDIIVDGWNRYNAARSLGIEYPVRQYLGKDVLLDVIAWQRSSRDWTPQQEHKIATALAKVVPHRSDDIWAAFHLAPTSDEVVAA